MKDSGEENNYISGNSEIIFSKNVSSRGLLHPLRGSPLPEGAKVATTSNEIPNIWVYRGVCFVALSFLSLPPRGRWHAKRDGRSLAV